MRQASSGDAVPVDRRRAFEIFEAAAELSGSARDALVRVECGDDSALHEEVTALLAHLDRNTRGTQSLLGVFGDEGDALVGRHFGHFRLLECIGQGGMGVVYRAERTDGIAQSVAVKLLSGRSSAAGQARFEREAHMLARLEHPAIARLIDAGTLDGRTWIAMELVQGLTIDAYCEEHRLPLSRRVALMAQLADAVAIAHRMLVLHRDIKPANVLVTADGQPKLIDFGVGTVLDEGHASRGLTVDGARLFTPNYAAPEQVSGEPVTVATDVFGLGALAYRLLAERAPYAHSSGPLQYMLAVTRDAVVPPSRAVERDGGGARIARALQGDLDAIVLKAMARDPADRYATAQEFAADLRRYLGHQPVLARPPSLAYRATRFVRRHAVATGAACLLLLGAGVGLAIYLAQARAVARASNIALQRGHFLEELLQSANPVSGRRDITVAELLDKVMRQSDAEIDPEPLVVASLMGILAKTNHALGRFPEAIAANERRLALLERNHGSAMERAAALGERGTLAWRTGHPNEAIEPLQTAVKLSGGDCKAGGLVYAEALENLGNVFEQVQRLDEAAAALQRSLDCARTIRTPQGIAQHIDTLNDVMVFEQLSGHTDAALKAGREAVALARTSLSADNPQRYIPVLNLAVIIVAKGGYAEAESMYREALAAETRLLGPDHSDTLVLMANLADDLLRMHRPEEALDLALRAAQGLEKAGGLKETHTISAWQIYGQAACLSGQAAAALPLLRRSVVLRTETDGTNGWRTHSARLVLGICLAHVHQDVEAEALLLQAAAGLQAARGTAFQRTQDAIAALRELYLARGDATAAARWAAKLQPP